MINLDQLTDDELRSLILKKQIEYIKLAQDNFLIYLEDSLLFDALKDVNFQVLGPVGDVVEEWTLKGTWILDAQFGDMDFATSDPVEITLTLRYDYAILQF